jgi:Squalene-hopene cyclase N-terminal domain
LAVSAKIEDAQSLKAVQQYLTSAASSARRLVKPSSTSRRKRVLRKSPSEKTIDEAISRRRLAIERDLSKIPSSVEKAWAALAYEVVSQPQDDGPPDALYAFGVDEARKRFKTNIAYRRQNLLSGKALASSARGYEQYWFTSYLRYYETFEPKDARALLLSEAASIEDEMRDSAALTTIVGDHGVYSVPHFLDLMVAYGRCRIVRNGLFRIARRAIPSILKWQRAGGAWTNFEPSRGSGNPLLVEDPSSTAAAVIFLARYASAQERDAAFSRSRTWLIGAQNADGSWSIRPLRRTGLPISTTVNVLEALRLIGIPADHPAVWRGEEFLIKQQQPPGLWWEKSGRWETHMTAQILEYFQLRGERVVALNSYLQSARSLLLKSEQLTLSEDNADGPLATVSAYHGVEHFLYGCLLEMDANELIYAEKGSTIGFNSALGVLERTLKEVGKLGINARLPYRQQLQHLATKRDMFIHRAEAISMEEAFGFVAMCRAFIQRFDSIILGFRLCE